MNDPVTLPGVIVIVDELGRRGGVSAQRGDVDHTARRDSCRQGEANGTRTASCDPGNNVSRGRATRWRESHRVAGRAAVGEGQEPGWTPKAQHSGSAGQGTP